MSCELHPRGEGQIGRGVLPAERARAHASGHHRSVVRKLVKIRITDPWLGSIRIAVDATQRIAVRLPDSRRKLPTLGDRLPRWADVYLNVDMRRRSIVHLSDFLVVGTANE
jgi:hypothetical protein